MNTPSSDAGASSIERVRWSDCEPIRHHAAHRRWYTMQMRQAARTEQCTLPPPSALAALRDVTTLGGMWGGMGDVSQSWVDGESQEDLATLRVGPHHNSSYCVDRGCGPRRWGVQLCRGFQNMKFDGQRYTTNEIDDPIVDPILERGDPKAQLCRGFQNMKFDGQGTPTREGPRKRGTLPRRRVGARRHLCRRRHRRRLRSHFGSNSSSAEAGQRPLLRASPLAAACPPPAAAAALLGPPALELAPAATHRRSSQRRMSMKP